MNRTIFLLVAAILIAPICAQERPAEISTPTLTEEEKANGWKLLFDGRTLEGWNSWRTKKALKADRWVVNEGTIELSKKGGGDIYTAEAFEHFELSLEWKTTGNSGLFIRVDPSQKGAIYFAAPEMQIERNAGKGSTAAGGFYGLYAFEGKKVIHPDGWNHVKIRLVNNHGVHWFNGIKACEYTIGSDDWKARIAKSKFKKWPAFAKLAKGHIGFQDHGHKVSFRNIRIRVIDPENVEAK
jgi:hypothetical protein